MSNPLLPLFIAAAAAVGLIALLNLALSFVAKRRIRRFREHGTPLTFWNSPQFAGMCVTLAIVVGGLLFLHWSYT